MKKIILSFFLIGCLFLGSCKKEPISPANQAYIGNWTGDYTEIRINSDGSGDYFYDDGVLTKQLSGRVKIGGGELKISASFVSKKYHIDKVPYKDANGGMTMVLSGEYFTRP